MAPTKHSAVLVASTPPKHSEYGSMLTSLKSSILNTKAKLGALRPQGQPKVTKTINNSKAITARERRKQAIERHSKVEAEQQKDSELFKPEIATVPSLASHPHPSLSAHDFEVGGTLGRGKFGRVYLARHLSTNYVCALKILSKSQCINQEEEKLIRRELEIHQNLAHKNILKFLSWFHDEEKIYLVLEYAAGGSLYSKLTKQPKGRFDERTTAQYIAQMAEALRYMHSKNIMHRDIKPENILLGFHNEIKLADFGYSVHSDSGFRSTVCGTLDYLSPEVAVMLLKPGKTREYYSKAIDQWSLGVLTYELLVGKPPFEQKSSKATQKKIANFKGNGLKFPGHVSKGAEDLIQELLNLDAEKRMSLDDVLVHAWIVRHTEKSAQSGIRSFSHMLEQAT
ncbi:Pkinase-domain-containing protein [Cucurbitaria berberidis CBS 394.84]|uniref:Aurora kinase n=1 Tax=Cucurbitaria berberidis CBS 394.84 TaxID=1168544 RepID=A0A9P4GQK6_9PLEO|nr:Pkinase-domain-containing protein [Cucurbitaria berberidis CBS 394.84]KAF1849947.1 Pkinase-domain-containing protein [Cucurbitaria berberidis CBS 394.84]